MKREDEIARVTLTGSVVNLLLVGLKAVAGLVGHSAAMISDAVHSLSDFVTDIVVLVFVRVSARPQDEDHDYGHGKYETLATLFIGLALAAAAVGIVVSGAGKLARWLQGEDLPAPGKIALWAALSDFLCQFYFLVNTNQRCTSNFYQILVQSLTRTVGDALLNLKLSHSIITLLST